MPFSQHLATGIGLLFLASGLLKVLVLPDLELSRYMAKEFHRYAEVFPFRHIGFTIEADLYRTIIGSIEIASGALLAFGHHPWNRFSAIELLVLMLGAAYTHFAVGDDLGQAATPVVLAVLLLFILNRN